MSFQPKTHFRNSRRPFFKIKTRWRPPRPATRACFQKTHFSEKDRKPTFEKWVLHDLTYMKDTQQIPILCLYTWVFRILLPLYFNSKEPVLVEIAVEIGKISVFQESDVFGFFWEVILGGSQEILLNILTKWLGILRKNVAMVLIKLLPNTF